MHFKKLAIPEVILMSPKVFGDERGFFMETFRRSEFEAYFGAYTFVQDKHSLSVLWHASWYPLSVKKTRVSKCA